MNVISEILTLIRPSGLTVAVELTESDADNNFRVQGKLLISAGIFPRTIERLVIHLAVSSSDEKYVIRENITLPMDEIGRLWRPVYNQKILHTARYRLEEEESARIIDSQNLADDIQFSCRETKRFPFSLALSEGSPRRKPGARIEIITHGILKKARDLWKSFII